MHWVLAGFAAEGRAASATRFLWAKLVAASGPTARQLAAAECIVAHRGFVWDAVAICDFAAQLSSAGCQQDGGGTHDLQGRM